MDMEDIPIVSIIIPVYKVERYLDQCIQSVVKQTYTNIEIILVDDGSPDRCPQICDAWKEKDSRIRVIHKENGGLSDARNVGMAASTGEYIAFVDSDDVVEPEYVEYLYEAIRDTGAEVSQCQFRHFKDDSELTDFYKKKKLPVLQPREEALFIFCNKAPKKNHYVWDKLYHRSLLENETFALGFRAQDVLFSCHIFTKAKEIAIVDNVLYNYRIRSGSASDGFIIQRLHAIEMYLRSIEHLKTGFPEAARELKVYCCSLCIGTMEWLNDTSGTTEKNRIFRQIAACRKRIHFSKQELHSCSVSDWIRIILSLPMLIWPYIRLRRLFAPVLDRRAAGFSR